MKTEEWKDVVGYEGLYEVSNLGNVRSVDKYIPFNGTISLRKGIVLKQGIVQGYKQVVLCKHGKTKNYRVHRLVAQTFIPNPDNLPEINHKDEDKTNNRVDNLEFCTYKYNSNYGKCKQKISKALKGKLINRTDQSKPILQFTKKGEFVAEYPSQKEAERQTGVNSGNISLCCGCKLKSAGGYKWQYKNC